MEMATPPGAPAREQTPLMILADLAQDIQAIKTNASIAYKQLGVLGDQLYTIINDKESYAPLCQKAEEDLIAVHFSLISLYDPPITQTLQGAQLAERKVNEAMGKIESHYDYQLNFKD